MSKSLIPKVELPRYFTVTSMGLGPKQVAVKTTAELAHGDHYEKTHTFDKTNLVLDDFVDLFSIDRSKIPTLAKVFLAAIALPREFELAASRVDSNKNQIRLSFELRGDSTKTWAKTFDASSLNLTDLAVLLDWAKEAVKYQR
jgi:hypothetical protein